jgi:hypothetical protein
VSGFAHSSRVKLTPRSAPHFQGETLFDRIGRTLCQADCLPRKELYESWELARRARRFLRGGRVVDLGGGQGLVAHLMLLLDDSSPSAAVVDPHLPPSAATVHAVIVREWPRLEGRIEFVSAGMDEARIEAGDVVVASHACGALTDRVIDRVVESGARVALLPCCHDLEVCDAGVLDGWLEGPVAVDVMRAVRLQQRGYRVRTQTIPREITPMNRLLIADPPAGNP